MQADAIGALEDICEQVMNSLRPYGIDRLGYYFRDKRGTSFLNRKRMMQKMMRDIIDLREDLLADVEYQDVQEDKEVFSGTQHTYSKALGGSITSLMVSGHQCRFVVAESVNIWLLPANIFILGGMVSNSRY